MPVLSGPEIVDCVTVGTIVITPFDLRRVNSNSYNLRLGRQLTVYRKGIEHHHDIGNYFRDRGTVTAGKWPKPPFLPEPLDMAKPEEHVTFEIPEDGFVLYPGVLYLASTMEYTETPQHVPTIEGRSSVGRLGLTTHVTAGFGDQGFKGTWTLELAVVQPLRIYAGVEVCQIVYNTVEGAPKPYDGKYQGQQPPQVSGLWREFQKNDPEG